MIKTFKNLILSALFLMSATPLLATHAAGGNISYVCTGIPNTYFVTLTIYRDCGGAGLGNTEWIDIVSDCAGLTMPNVQLTKQSITEVSQICTAELPNTECSGGALSGIEEHVYTATVVLPGPCDAWTFSWELGNRNASTNLVNADGEWFYIETKMYSSTNDCNNSPTFNSQPIPYVCANQATNYDFGILELDGDSLDFSFVNALGQGGSMLTYAGGFTSAQPIPGIIMDPVTGLLTFTQGVNGNYVLTILIKEYDICDNLVGSMMHDIQIVVEACTNSVPTLVEPAGQSFVQNFNAFGTNAVLLPDNSINLCTGDRFCFDVQFDDPNAGDIVNLFSNVDDFLPGATFTTTPGNPAIGTVCWEFTQGYTGSAISINASDDKCPVPGFADVVVKLDVPPAIFPGGDNVVFLCGTEGGIDLYNYLVGFFQADGQWYDPNDQMISNFQDPATMITGNYYYVVLPDTTGTLCGSPPNPCVLADTAFIDVTTANLGLNWIEDSLSNETCFGTDDGTASVQPSGNFAPFTVVWTSPFNGVHATQTVAADSLTTINTLYQDQNGSIPWTVTVTDDNNCSETHNFVILAGGLDFEYEFGPPTCFGYDNGSFIVTTLGPGGTPTPPSDVFLTITETISGDTINGADQNPAVYGSTVTGLSAGDYTIYASDMLGCAADFTISLDNPAPAPMELEFEQLDVKCFGDATGSITITDVLNVGTAEDFEDLDFKWTPIPPGNDPNGQGRYFLKDLPAGEYTLIITNSNSCNTVPNPYIFNITEPLKLQGEPYIKQNLLCRSFGYQSGNGQVAVRPIAPLTSFGGTGNVSTNWTHLVSGATSKAPEMNIKEPGNVRILIRDDNDCVFIDTIYMDSINPKAGFTLTSDQFYVSDIYEGQEELRIRAQLDKGISSSFIQEGNPNSKVEYQWNLNTGQINDQNKWFFTFDSITRPDTSYLAVNTDGPTTYQVCLVVKNFNDCADTACRDVVVHKTPELILPNVFTPGTTSNPVNDFFYFPVAGYSEFKATVFNRYGVKVYEFEELTDKWDGNHYKTGKECSDGVYTFEYRSVTTNGTENSGTGQIHLIRHKN
ncbi:MAG: gliding motility-associated C-terminal domain-containing protein [Crocinitomicaceae bacterium]